MNLTPVRSLELSRYIALAVTLALILLPLPFAAPLAGGHAMTFAAVVQTGFGAWTTLIWVGVMLALVVWRWVHRDGLSRGLTSALAIGGFLCLLQRHVIIFGGPRFDAGFGSWTLDIAGAAFAFATVALAGFDAEAKRPQRA